MQTTPVYHLSIYDDYKNRHKRQNGKIYTFFSIGESLMSIKREYSKWKLNEWRKKCFYRINDIYWWALWYSGYPLLPLLVWTHHLHAIKRQFPSIEYFTVVSNGKFYAQQLLIIKNDGHKNQSRLSSTNFPFRYTERCIDWQTYTSFISTKVSCVKGMENNRRETKPWTITSSSKHTK